MRYVYISKIYFDFLKRIIPLECWILVFRTKASQDLIHEITSKQIPHITTNSRFIV